MLRRTAAIAAALVVIALPSAASAGTAGDPMTGAPTVGSCYDITLKQAGGQSITKDPVGCRQAHTTVVSAVATLPSRLDWSSSASEIAAVASKTCSAALSDRIGTNLLQHSRSQYMTFWFIPTQAQQDAGARWYDCMIGVPEDSRLSTLPRTLPHLSAKLPNSVARCVTAKYKSTTCADSHTWRSSYAFYVTGKATTRNVNAAAKRTCPSHVSTRSWLLSSWDIPGKRFIVDCYSKTSR